ncbi:hypothetical protein C8R43DRAFT_930531 [Mycena crocata]|nr:hypothetical protein C8R43DRAFT_930531 [Mycena crocata]
MDEEEKQKTKGPSLKAIIDAKRARAWQLHTWPGEKFLVRRRSKLHLPRSYLSKDGEDIEIIFADTDINQFVHQYYLQHIDPKSVEWVNFVHADDVVARRHEFLGPDPRVAGYEIDGGGNVYIRWWDGFLSDQWSGTQKWKLAVEWDDDVQKWVEKKD